MVKLVANNCVSILGSCCCFIVLTMLLLPSSSLVNAAIVCPPAAAIAPCTCGEHSIPSDGNIYLICSSQNLTDSRISDILVTYIMTPGVSPLKVMHISFNQLMTRIPSEI